MSLRRSYGWCRECGMWDGDENGAGVYEVNIVTADGVLMKELCFACLHEIAVAKPEHEIVPIITKEDASWKPRQPPVT